MRSKVDLSDFYILIVIPLALVLIMGTYTGKVNVIEIMTVVNTIVKQLIELIIYVSGEILRVINW